MFLLFSLFLADPYHSWWQMFAKLKLEIKSCLLHMNFLYF